MIVEWSLRQVRVGSVSLRCRQAGQGKTGPGESAQGERPPVVLLHGGGSGAGTWEAFAVPLTAAGRRAVAVDLRGHGGSTRTRDYPLDAFRDDVLGLLDVLGLDRVAMVGHSLGAYVALAVAAGDPGRVRRLVLEDPPTRPRGETDRRPVSGPADWARFVVFGAAGLLGRRRFDPRMLASVITQLRRPEPGWWDALASVAAPTLVVSGGPSSHLSPERAAELAAALPAGELVTIPVGHRVHSLAPERFAAAVLPFLARDLARDLTRDAGTS